MDMNMNEMIQAVAQGVAQGMGRKSAYGMKAPAGNPPGNLIHGPGGIFGLSGLEQGVISGRITPTGLSSMLRAFPDNKMQPLFPYITGIEEVAGQTEPTGQCETCLSGETESCIQLAQYGRICRETKELVVEDIIERINNGQIDLQLVNDILGGVQGDLLNVRFNYDRNTVLQIMTAWAMLEVGALFQQVLMPMLWQGNPANNVGSGYAEFPGLDILISTNKVDAITGVNCQALYSDVKEFGYQLVNSVDAAGNFNIVRLLSYLEAFLFHNASRQHLTPATWAVVMRPELWYELTEIWPIAWLSTRNITLPAGNTNFIDASRVSQMRDEIREGMFLFLNGRRHPVVLDDGIYEANSANDANLAAGEFASNIYMVPLTYLGGRPATYLQHKNYNAANADLRLAKIDDRIWHTDNGRFLWTSETQKWCYTISGLVEPRVVLRTPQLAGRINDIRYVPAQHFRQPFQDQAYFSKGGVSVRTPSTYYSDWNLPQGR